MKDLETINLAEFYHPHGFHRDKGKYPGERLYELLRLRTNQVFSSGDAVKIDLDGMQTLYGSFVDGAFGLFIDEFKEEFFKKFIFLGGKQEFYTVINRVFRRHKERDFNSEISS